MTFYIFIQQPSGGKLHIDEKAGVGSEVFIEARNPSEANSRFLKLRGTYFYGVDENKDCSCCGDRWNPAEYDLVTEKPKIQLIWRDAPSFIHYLDGKIEKFISVAPVKEKISYEELQHKVIEIPEGNLIPNPFRAAPVTADSSTVYTQSGYTETMTPTDLRLSLPRNFFLRITR